MMADESLRILVDGVKKFTSLESVVFSFKGYLGEFLLILQDWLGVEGLLIKGFEYLVNPSKDLLLWKE